MHSKCSKFQLTSDHYWSKCSSLDEPSEASAGGTDSSFLPSICSSSAPSSIDPTWSIPVLLTGKKNKGYSFRENPETVGGGRQQGILTHLYSGRVERQNLPYLKSTCPQVFPSQKFYIHPTQ